MSEEPGTVSWRELVLLLRADRQAGLMTTFAIIEELQMLVPYSLCYSSIDVIFNSCSNKPKINEASSS